MGIEVARRLEATGVQMTKSPQVRTFRCPRMAALPGVVSPRYMALFALAGPGQANDVHRGHSLELWGISIGTTWWLRLGVG
jgi:hypothetical protein